MALRVQLRRKRTAAAVLTLVTLLTVAPSALASKKFEGRWAISITIPVEPKSKTTRTFTVNFDASPRGDSLHARVIITDDEGRAIGGVWRQVNKKVSITYELPCPHDGSAPCASLVLSGKLKSSNNRIKGSVIVMWDTENAENPALFDTSNGSFSGDRLE